MTSPGPYRLTGDKMLQTIENWDRLMNFRVQLIACGGTALTLLKIKESRYGQFNEKRRFD